jgi:TRAP-type C4-dicarboxylate transport system permease large subunit
LLILFGAAGLFIAVFHFMRLRHDSEDHRTLQEAIRAGSPIAEPLFEQLRDRPRRRSQTTGLVLLGIAAAILIAGVIRGGEETIRSAAAAAVFPAFIGGVIWWRSLLKRRGG